MKVEVKKLDGSKREINVEVSGEIIKNKFEEVFKKIGQEAKVAGFRQGHIPRDILEKNFSAYAHELVMKELIPDIYTQAVKKEALDVVDSPEITDVKLDRGSLSFKASVDVSPEVNLKNYKGIKLTPKKVEVTLDDVKRNIDTLKESRKVETVDESFAKSLGYPNLASLEKFIETQLFLQNQNTERRRIEEELLAGLTKDLDFKIPQSMVNRQVQEMLRSAKLDLAMKGVDRQEIEKNEKLLIDQVTPEAKEQVKIYLILSEVARKENIPVDQHMPQKVVELLLREADWKEVA